MMTATYRLFATNDQTMYINWERAEQPSHKVFENAGGAYLVAGSGLVATGVYLAVGTALTVTGVLICSAGVALLGYGIYLGMQAVQAHEKLKTEIEIDVELCEQPIPTSCWDKWKVC